LPLPSEFTKQFLSCGLSYLGCLVDIIIDAEAIGCAVFSYLNSPLPPVWVDVPGTGLTTFVRSVLCSSRESQVINVDARCTAMVFADNEHTVRDGSINPLPSVTVCPLYPPVEFNSAIPFLGF